MNPASLQSHHHSGRYRPGLWVLLAIALFYLLTEHRAHFFGALPYLLLLACPLMHLFMHGGHGGHRHHHGPAAEDDTAKREEKRP